jgi:hypothetical protein
MATRAEYEIMAREWDRAALLSVWERLDGGPLAGWENGKAFEYLVVRAFELEGAEVQYPFTVTTKTGLPIEQLDGVAYFDGLTVIFEAKDWKGPVNVEPLAKLRSQLARRPSSTIGAVFTGCRTTSAFTEAARQLAGFFAPQTVLLWSGEDVHFSIERGKMRQGMLVKMRHMVEQVMPDYDLRTESCP